MKRWLAFAIIAMLFAVPLAYGHGGVNDMDEGTGSATQMDDDPTVGDMDQSNVGKENNDYQTTPAKPIIKPVERVPAKRIVENGREVVKETREIREKAREIREKAKEIRNEFKKDYQEYKELRNQWKIAKRELIEVRKSDKVLLQEKAKIFLERGVELAKRNLEMIKNRIENDPFISEEKKQELIAKIDSYIEWISSKEGELNNADDLEKLREIAVEFKEKWEEARKEATIAVGDIAIERFDYLSEKVRQAGERVKEILDKYEEEGYDVSKAREYYNRYVEKYESMVQKYEELKQKWKEAKEDGPQLSEKRRGVNEIIIEAKRLLKEVRETAREAYKNLKEVIKELKKAKEVSE